jgi:hypothetical protein
MMSKRGGQIARREQSQNNGPATTMTASAI